MTLKTRYVVRELSSLNQYATNSLRMRMFFIEQFFLLGDKVLYRKHFRFCQSKNKNHCEYALRKNRKHVRNPLWCCMHVC
ncbi:hypothetical protein GJ496_011811 [Pomphorhynchus laevis]|nr:hypothetical protein GJ496_011811 [Pomphorhynchus laevis]